jgi:hypothetical protein
MSLLWILVSIVIGGICAMSALVAYFATIWLFDWFFVKQLRQCAEDLADFDNVRCSANDIRKLLLQPALNVPEWVIDWAHLFSCRSRILGFAVYVRLTLERRKDLKREFEYDALVAAFNDKYARHLYVWDEFMKDTTGWGVCVSINCIDYCWAAFYATHNYKKYIGKILLCVTHPNTPMGYKCTIGWSIASHYVDKGKKRLPQKWRHMLDEQIKNSSPM